MAPALFIPSTAPRLSHSTFQSPLRHPRPPTATLPLSTPTPSRPTRSLSHAKILSQTADALSSLTESLIGDERRVRLTVDFPPERSEERSGTLVARYENNLNFLEKLVVSLGGSASAARPVGPEISIRDNVNPQGGGEYLSDDEAVVGLRVDSVPALQGRGLLALINAGVDVSTLKQVKGLDVQDEDVVLLLNCGLEKLSWFAKFGVGDYFDEYEAAYYLKRIGGNGWMIKNGLEKWKTVYVNEGGQDIVLEETEARPKIVDAEALIRLAVAGISP